MLFVPCCTHTNKRAAHTRGRRGTDTCRVFVTSSVDICDRVALWERRPSVVGEAGLEGGRRARCFMLLFSVGLSRAKCCAVMVFLLFSLLLVLLSYGKRGALNNALNNAPACLLLMVAAHSRGHYCLLFCRCNTRAVYAKAMSL